MTPFSRALITIIEQYRAGRILDSELEDAIAESTKCYYALAGWLARRIRSNTFTPIT